MPPAASTSPDRISPKKSPLDEALAKASFFLFAAGALAGILQLSYPFGPGAKPEIEFGDGFEMVAIAKNLADHGTFANPFLNQTTGPTAVEPPLYPFLLALPTKLLKQPDLISIVAVIGNISMNAVTAALLPRISLLVFGEMAPGIAAALLWLAAVRLMPAWDTGYTVAGLLAFCVFSAYSIGRKKNTTGFGIAAGVIAGLVFLSNPASVLVSGAWVGYLLLLRKEPVKQVAKYCCALLATLLLIALAWGLRNKHELGAMTQRTNLGMTLYVSQNDCAQASLDQEIRTGCYQARHPNHSAAEGRLLQSLGEVEYDRLRTANAMSWIAAHPDRFRSLTLQRFREFWFPTPEQRAYMDYIIWLATALSVPGLILMALRRERSIWFVLTALLIYPPVYYLVVSGVRYRYPVLWISLLPAGYLLVALARLLRVDASTSPRRSRLPG